MRLIPVLISFFILGACSQVAAPVTHYGVRAGGGSAGVHTVSAGENLWAISNRYNIVMRDIAAANDLSPPFVLASGQRLILPPPREYRVRPGDTLYTISRLYGVSASEVARVNDLAPPYRVVPAQILRLPSVTRGADVQVAAAQGGARGAAADVERTVLAPPQRQTPDGGAGVVTPGRKPDRGIDVVKNDVQPRSKRLVDTPKRSSSKFLKPVRGDVVSGYGPKKNGLHNDGINIRAARGTPVKAAENGVVVYAGDGLKESGNLVLVRHENRWMTAYGHLDSIGIKSGDIVRRGQQIGKVGSSGAVREPQLHFEVRRGTEALNPKPYIEG